MPHEEAQLHIPSAEVAHDPYVQDSCINALSIKEINKRKGLMLLKWRNTVCCYGSFDVTENNEKQNPNCVFEQYR